MAQKHVWNCSLLSRCRGDRSKLRSVEIEEHIFGKTALDMCALSSRKQHSSVRACGIHYTYIHTYIHTYINTYTYVYACGVWRVFSLRPSGLTRRRSSQTSERAARHCFTPFVFSHQFTSNSPFPQHMRSKISQPYSWNVDLGDGLGRVAMKVQEHLETPH